MPFKSIAPFLLIILLFIGCQSNKLLPVYFGNYSYSVTTPERRWIGYLTTQDMQAHENQLRLRDRSIYNANDMVMDITPKKMAPVRVNGSFRFEARPDGKSAGFLLFAVKTDAPIGTLNGARFRSMLQKPAADTLLNCQPVDKCANPLLLAAGSTASGKCISHYQIQLRPLSFFRALNGMYIIQLMSSKGDTLAFTPPFNYNDPVLKRMFNAIDTTVYK
jgi:hypothetical protein